MSVTCDVCNGGMEGHHYNTPPLLLRPLLLLLSETVNVLVQATLRSEAWQENWFEGHFYLQISEEVPPPGLLAAIVLQDGLHLRTKLEARLGQGL